MVIMLLEVANGEMIPIYKNKKQKDILGPSTWYTDYQYLFLHL